MEWKFFAWVRTTGVTIESLHRDAGQWALSAHKSGFVVGVCAWGRTVTSPQNAACVLEAKPSSPHWDIRAIHIFVCT